jgi:outer membrane protein TolC
LAQQESANSTLATLSGPQIHVRRQQAELGVAAAQAGVTQAEQETTNAVTRSYLSVLFAREQLQVAEGTVGSFKNLQDITKKLIDAGAKEVTTADLDRIEAYRLIAETRASEARQGHVRAKAALREAIGLGPDCVVELAEDQLSRYYDRARQYQDTHGLQFCCNRAVEVALQYRPELAQASLLAEVTHLEVKAQGLTLHSYARTFAATADIHAKILPATVMDGDYRPGPLGPEMPVYLAGSPSARQQQAGILHARMLAVSDKARGLVALEVEDACARLRGRAEQVEALRKAVQKTEKLVKEAETAFRADQLKASEMLTAQGFDALTRAQLNEATYQYGLALATLQRATAGHLWDCLDKAPGTGQSGK